jgi:chromosomal replication initiation ATPase DnaA
MAVVMLRADKFPLENILDFLSQYPPTLGEIFLAVCWTYQIKPDQIRSERAQLARDVFCYIATNWTCKQTESVGIRVGFSAYQVFCAVKRIKSRLEDDELLRDDLDLLGVRLAEKALEKKKDRCHHE